MFYLINIKMETVFLENISLNSKILLLKKLGYGTDGEFVLNSEGAQVKDRYLDIPVRIENMMILPGSEIILDNNEFSLSSYVEEFGKDVLG